MGICLSGMNDKLNGTTVAIHVPENHAYLQLANALDWDVMRDMVMEDLKKSTTKLRWWIGRKLKLRIHLAVFLLQSHLKMTDRAIEAAIQGNGIYQVFCGCTILDDWHCPDHTKIEEFRNRIQPETQRRLANYVTEVARQFGFADPSKMDVDSTVQEANMAYPADAHLLVKLGKMCKKVTDFLKENASSRGRRTKEACVGFNTKMANLRSRIQKIVPVDLKAINKKGKSYFFMARNTPMEKRREAFRDLYETVKEQVNAGIGLTTSMDTETLQLLPWNIRRSTRQIRTYAKQYLDDVASFIQTHTIKAGKILSFHAHQVACIIKGKVGKPMEFGRVFQLGRIGGNYFILAPCTTIRQEDKQSLLAMVDQHQRIFGKDSLISLGTDKGYYSKDNIKQLNKIQQLAIQAPTNVKNPIHIPQPLKDRRAGIEPLIHHAKEFGLRKSKAKSDTTTLASGYRSVMAFNLNQFMRDLTEEKKMQNQ